MTYFWELCLEYNSKYKFWFKWDKHVINVAVIINYWILSEYQCKNKKVQEKVCHSFLNFIKPSNLWNEKQNEKYIIFIISLNINAGITIFSSKGFLNVFYKVIFVT